MNFIIILISLAIIFFLNSKQIFNILILLFLLCLIITFQYDLFFKNLNDNKVKITKTYMKTYVSKSENILNKKEVIKEIEKCKIKIPLIKNKSKNGNYLYSKNRNYIFLNSKKLSVIEHEFFHLIDKHSKRKEKINYNLLINKNITKDEYCKILDSFKYRYKSRISILLKNNKLNIEKDSIISFKNYNSEELYLNIIKNKEYYLSEDELFVRLNLMKLHFKKYLNKKNYYFITNIDNLIIFKNGFLSIINIINEYDNDILNQYYYLIPFLKNNPEEFKKLF